MARSSIAPSIVFSILAFVSWSMPAYSVRFRRSSLAGPWGQVFPVDVGKLRFPAAIEGIMYVETAQGEMDEAFASCPIVHNIDALDGRSLATGNCVFVVSPTDSVFAEISCQGIAGLCDGELAG